MSQKYSTNRKLPFKALIVTAALLIAVLAILIASGVIHRTHKIDTRHAVTGSVYTKGDAKSSPSSHNSNTAQPPTSTVPPSNDQKANDSFNSSSATLLAPTGNFISNHHPNLGGSPAPNTESSVCTSTPGATCKITFTKDGMSKELPAETTDSGGSAYWSWKLQDIGLTVGSWQVQAVVSMNGQTRTATDAMALEVAQ